MISRLPTLRSAPRALLLALLLLGAAGCAATGESRDEEAPPRRAAAPPGFEPRNEAVGTIQLYRTGDEASLPVLAVGSGHTLTLAFDLVRESGRPLSVFFYHADRTWRRDLVPAEYLTSFQRDDLLDYTPSRVTQVPYTHYRYEFPNRSIGFRLSGNYVVRVTEQGMEDEVLFERPFFVSEQAAPAEFAIGRVMVSGSPSPFLQPTLAFTPPDPTYGNAFDYTVCFRRNGLVDEGRCTSDPSLAMAPELRYFLEPEDSFGPSAADHFVDLSDIRPGPRVERVDLTSSPFRVTVEPDYIRFPGAFASPLLNGNPVVEEAVTSVLEPSISAEYVVAGFALVPEDDTPVRGDVHLLGSFNDWRRVPEHRMTWNADRRRYEGSVLLKQGQYEYRYGFDDARVRQQVALDAPLRLDNILTAFIYFSDVRVSTDRLITTVSVRSR